MKKASRTWYDVAFVLAILITIFSTTELGAQQNLFSLEEAIDYAEKNNPNIKVSETDLAIGEEVIRETRATGLPQVNSSLNYQYFLQIPISIIPDFTDPSKDIELAFGTRNNLAAGVEASQLLFSGSYLVAIKAAKTFSELNEGNLEQAKISIRQQVTQAYYQVLVAREQTNLLKNNKSNLEKVLFETSQLFANGFVEKIDVDRLQLSLSNLDVQIQSANRSINLSKSFLKFQMGMPQKDSLKLEDDLNTVFEEINPFTYGGKFSPENRIEYRNLGIQKELAKLDKESVEWQRYPTVSLFGSYQQVFQDDNFGRILNVDSWFPTFVVGLNVSLPIFTGFRTDAQIKQKSLQSLQITTAQDLLEKSFEFEITQAKLTYKNALNQKINQEKNIELAQRIYDVSLIKYNEGLGSSLEVNTAESELFQTQSLYIQALYDIIVAKVNLDKALGNF